MLDNFWDSLSFNTFINIRDDYNSFKANKSKEQSCDRGADDIIDASSQLIEAVNFIAMQSNSSIEVTNDAVKLPAFAFLKVLKMQQSNPTDLQLQAVDSYLKSINSNSLLDEFLIAININNDFKKDIDETVGISQKTAGRFWKSFLSGVASSEGCENSIKVVIEKFVLIVFRFSMLGSISCTKVIDLCESFIKALKKQFFYSLSQNKSKSKLSSESYFKHFAKMKSICKDLVKSDDEESPVLLNVFDYFIIGLLYTVIDMSPILFVVKAEILDIALKKCNIDIGLDGYQVAYEISEQGSLCEITYGLSSCWDEDNLNFWKMILFSSQKVGLPALALDFSQECLSFLIAVEKELAYEFPSSGLADLSKKYMVNTANQINLLVK